MLSMLSIPILAAAAAATPPRVVVSTAETGRTLAVTVYNVGRGLVRDTRNVDLPEGVSALEFRDIAASVMPPTVAVDGAGVEVLEQNYEYDLLSPQTLLEKYVGRDVTLVLDEPGEIPGSTVSRKVTGTLLSARGGTIWRVGSDIVLNPPTRELIFPRVPANLRDRPTLVWLLDVAGAGPHELTATYLTEGMSWEADYVLSTGNGDGAASLLGWVSVTNSSGASYEHATLQLVAGDVNTVSSPQGPRPLMMAKEMSAAPRAQEETLGEFHLYTIARPTDLKDQQKKQIAFLEAKGLGVVTRYRMDTTPPMFRTQAQEDKPPVRADLELENTKANHLGIPLPAGTVRVYRADSAGRSQFVGEDHIRHTPSDEVVTVTMGTAFDVTATRKQTDFRKFDSTTEAAFETVLSNHKDENIVVEVRDRIGGDWEILSSSLPATKESASTILFRVSVPAHGKTSFTYRVRVTN